MEEAQHFRRQQAEAGQDYEDGKDLPDRHPPLPPGRVQAARNQRQNVECGEAKHKHPKDVVEVPALARQLPRREQYNRTGRPQ